MLTDNSAVAVGLICRRSTLYFVLALVAARLEAYSP